MDAIKVGKAIAYLRKQSGMTQEELAGKVGVSFKAVSRWENGHGAPDISIISKIAAILDIDVESLLEGNITQHDHDWTGVLFMKYPTGIGPDSMMYTLRTIEFQVGFFLLAGIKSIYIVGSDSCVEEASEHINKDRKFDVDIKYVSEPTENDFGKTRISTHGVMIIRSLNFIYGKDITRTFRRIMFEKTRPTVLTNSDKSLDIAYFIPGKVCGEVVFSDMSYEKYSFERGVISFPIKDEDDLLDASVLIKILEKHQGERIGDLEEIARRRVLG